MCDEHDRAQSTGTITAYRRKHKILRAGCDQGDRCGLLARRSGSIFLKAREYEFCSEKRETERLALCGLGEEDPIHMRSAADHRNMRSVAHDGVSFDIINSHRSQNDMVSKRYRSATIDSQSHLALHATRASIFQHPPTLLRRAYIDDASPIQLVLTKFNN